jgi:hypothetical protein
LRKIYNNFELNKQRNKYDEDELKKIISKPNFTCKGRFAENISLKESTTNITETNSHTHTSLSASLKF